MTSSANVPGKEDMSEACQGHLRANQPPPAPAGHGDTANGTPPPGIRWPHSFALASIRDECGSKPSLLTDMAKATRPRESEVGSGHFGTPCERMQAANLSPPFSISCVSARVQMPAASHCSSALLFTVLGSRCWQALWAV